MQRLRIEMHSVSRWWCNRWTLSLRCTVVEIYLSKVSTDGFHTKSILKNNHNILTNYLIFTVLQMHFGVEMRTVWWRNICTVAFDSTLISFWRGQLLWIQKYELWNFSLQVSFIFIFLDGSVTLRNLQDVSLSDPSPIMSALVGD